MKRLLAILGIVMILTAPVYGNDDIQFKPDAYNQTAMIACTKVEIQALRGTVDKQVYDLCDKIVNGYIKKIAQ